MAYREVTMVEIKEVVLLWMGGAKKKRIAAQLTVDVKTVRRYIQAARDAGLHGTALTDEQFGTVLQILAPTVERSHGEGLAEVRVGARRDRASPAAARPAVEGAALAVSPRCG